eukprot:m.233078 g.233078  ORF g.233078 m.233078 type:complete len:897 (+) comp40084_c0_seq19:912-3602(+)
MFVNFANKDGMSSLHQAVSGGNIEVVKLLLQRGCRLFLPEAEVESPFHLACSHGCVSMIQAILENCMVTVQTVLDSKDPNGQTPLHRAAIFDHTAVAEYLIKKGANVNTADNFGRTPLLLSAQAGSKKTMQYLLAKGADTAKRDANRRNVLHLAIIKQGQPIAEFLLSHSEAIPSSLLDDKDALGLTPVHYASKVGYVEPLELMLKRGASRNPKDRKKSTPLHFAAKYGQHGAAKQLLQGPVGQHIINEEDRQGLTPLHVACHNGFHQLVELLLREGAVIHRCARGASPLHWAAEGGYVHCLRVLLASHRYVLNWKDHMGNTALHSAVQAGHPHVVKYLLTECAEISPNKDGDSFLEKAIDTKQSQCALAALKHERWEESLSAVNRARGYPMMRLIEEMPEVAKVALDCCTTTSDLPKENKQFWFRYDFEYLLCNARIDCDKLELSRQKTHDESKADIAEKQEKMPLPGLTLMVQLDRKDLLCHPVSDALLTSRWQSYGQMNFYISTTFYLFYLVFLTSLISLLPLPVSSSNANVTMYRTANGTLTTDPKLSGYATACQYLVIILAVFYVVVEIMQMVQLKLKYLQDFRNYLTLVLYICTFVFVIPIGNTRNLYQLDVGAVCIFLAWMNFLLYLQRFEALGIYIVMFVEVLKTLLVVLGVFLVMIIAFGLSFYVILYPAEPSFTNIPKAFLTVFEVMLGEFSFKDYFILQNMEGLHHPALTWAMFIVLLIFMPIIFMNLLIGLAVGDIDSVRKNAELKRLAMLVEFHARLESKFPWRVKQKLCNNDTVYPNSSKGIQNILSFAYGGHNRFGERSANPDIVCLKEQMKKQKKRQEDMYKMMNKQHQLILALVQKMEVQAVIDTQKEGIDLEEDRFQVLPTSNYGQTKQLAIAKSELT